MIKKNETRFSTQNFKLYFVKQFFCIIHMIISIRKHDFFLRAVDACKWNGKYWVTNREMSTTCRDTLFDNYIHFAKASTPHFVYVTHLHSLELKILIIIYVEWCKTIKRDLTENINFDGIFQNPYYTLFGAFVIGNCDFNEHYLYVETQLFFNIKKFINLTICLFLCCSLDSRSCKDEIYRMGLGSGYCEGNLNFTTASEDDEVYTKKKVSRVRSFFFLDTQVW